MKNRIWKTGLLTACLAGGLMFGFGADAQAAGLPDGLRAGGQELGGLSRQEADEKIEEYVSGLQDRSVTIQAGDRTLETTSGELGLSWSNRDVVEETVASLTEGNLLKRYMALTDLEQEGAEIPVETAVDEAKLAALVETTFDGMDGSAKNASITRENGEFVITPSEKGIAVDTAATAQVVNAALAEAGDGPLTVEAVVSEQEPEITTEMLSTIQDVLGTFTTDFSSSGSARAKNLEVGAQKLNGHVLMPGETISGYECLQPFTRANGYEPAASYENGQVVDSIGGGVCQISTTMYNMALAAELEITQRQNHSMIVTYVKPSMDAAIAGTYKDLKVTNNYSTPIYIEAYTSGRKLTFTCYGQETRPENRKVEYVSETISRTDPGAPIERVNNALAPGTRRKVSSGHTGIRSRLWKVVTVDGVETERTLLNNDTYNASKAVYEVGPAAPAETPAPVEETPAQDTPPATEPQPSEGLDGGPGVGLGQGGSSQPAPTPETPAPAPETPAPPADPAPVTPSPETPAPTGDPAPVDPVPTAWAVPEHGERQGSFSPAAVSAYVA
ncbi:vanomycin resistance protein VanB [Lachnoclostridium sp. An14]|uniref:VanW family protein n=1 Tax=Lachnoclostridium sp. An14 TaxID=1965562 RepID=UPI000B3A21F9|nr:VanW family protein [Lachnoclostridium sp. An14]OUQ16489.1 vanomycin resistance protein VanB [Lachnoclostridium sp. An14]